MFVDASAIVAILTNEPEGDALSARLDAAEDASTSPVAVLEATMAVARKTKGDPRDEFEAIERFVFRAGIEQRSIPAALTREVVETYARYGKGQGSGAKLNMGDCFAYAMARHLGVPLLYKGDDFARTDLA